MAVVFGRFISSRHHVVGWSICSGVSRLLLKSNIYTYIECNNCYRDIYCLNTDSNSHRDKETVTQEVSFYPNGNKKSLTISYDDVSYFYNMNWDKYGNIQSCGTLGLDKDSIAPIDDSLYASGILSVKTSRYIKNGRWVYYNIDRSIKQIVYYSNGVLIDICR